MKRFAPLFLALAATLLLAQTPQPATLRTASGDKPIDTRQVAGFTYFAADDVVTALGGTVTKESNGYRATLGNSVAAFGPDSRFGVIKDDLIEMPAPPATIDNKPFVPIQFFQGFLGRTAQLDAVWDPAARVLTIRGGSANAVSVQVSVANVQGISKIVVTLGGPAEYSIVKEPNAYTIRFKTPIRPPFTDQTYEDPNVAKAEFVGNDLSIQLRAADVIGDAYRLDNPFRIVLDLRKGAPVAPGTPLPLTPTKPVELPGIRTIVIDPGHGGKEVGAVGPGGLLEKEATLALCRKLVDALEAKTHARVVLTRSDDSVVPLDQRTAIANQYKADLFLSVHMNAALVKGAHGAETYFLSQEASDRLAEQAAATENAASKPPAPQASTSDLKLILWDLAQQEYMTESSRFAQVVQEEMNRITGIQSRGVKQAPFKVLVGATMPAALVEVAFITNPDEEAKIKSDEFQRSVVEALTTAVDRYKTEYETRIGLVQPAAPVAAPTTTAPAPATTSPSTTTPSTNTPATTTTATTATRTGT